MNIGQIAKLAGVSSAAVSRYFNNGYISDAKREAIRKVVEETGYRPSLQAQTLRTRRTMMIGVIAPKMASSCIGRMVDGILDTLDGTSYQMLLAVTKHDPERELEYLDALREKNADGIILISKAFTNRHQALVSKIHIPVVIIDRQNKDTFRVSHRDCQISSDLTDEEAGKRGAAMLLELMQGKAPR